MLVADGQVLILDGNQKTLRESEWLTDIFEEPYICEYAASDLAATMDAVGFAAVQTQDVWWINQVTSGVKPISPTDVTAARKVQQYKHISIDSTIDNNDLEDFGSPIFGITA